MRRFNQGIVLTGVGLTLCLCGCLRDRLNPYDPLGGNYQGVNQAPVISSFACDPTVTNPGDTTTLTVSASDADGDDLSYAYTFTEGDGSIAGKGSGGEFGF